VSPDRQFLKADEPESFAAAAARLAEWSVRPEEGDVARLIADARDAVGTLFWPGIADRLVQLYRSELARLPQPGASVSTS
jgi:hypothetical protein